MREIALGLLAAYLVAGCFFSYTILRTIWPVIVTMKAPRWAFWITTMFLFFRWACGWLPIVIYYRTRR